MFLPGSHTLTHEPAIPAGTIDPPGALTPALTEGDAVLLENRTWHAGGVNLSGHLRIALMFQYGYRWLHPVDDPATDLMTDPTTNPIVRQLLGMPDHNEDGSLAKGAGAAPLKNWRSSRLHTPPPGPN
ncbi:hypothetical protein ACFXKG_13830 [Streptomyces sp. NPDC059255]|uniref:hypothetical protein n=1 Tax=Streptomyces sp. NPDC059255 TaxID=3346793 RepID=UPI0036B65904